MSTPERGLRTLVVWCPDWPLVAAGIHPDVPAAVFHANRVVACTAGARAEGVTRGLRRREAQGRCPELGIEQLDPGRDARAFEPVVAAVEAFTPRVEVTRPGACALPTRGPSRYFGGDEALAERIRAAVDAVLEARVGAPVPPAIRTRVGIADGPFTAAQAARRGLVVPGGASAAFLAPLPITVLAEPQLTDLLVRLGLRTLGAFAELATGDVIGRFGPVGIAAHRRARGLDDRPLDSRMPPADLTVNMALDPPADRVDTAAFAGKALADRLCSTLAEAGLVCPCIRIEAETEHGEHLSRVWRHHRAFTPGTVSERVRWQLDGWLAERTRCGCLPGEECPGGAACPNPAGGTTGGLTLLRLVPEEVDPDDGRQGGFWGGVTEADERAARGMARVQGLLGPDAVMTAVLGGGRGPAEQVRLVRWGDPRSPVRAGEPNPHQVPKRPPRRAAVPKALKAPAAPKDPAAPAAPAARVAAPGTRVRTSGRSPSPSEVASWPGRVPAPAPARVPVSALPAALVDGQDVPIGVTNRSFLTRPPGRLSISGARWTPIAGWAGPWTADERWWDPTAHRRIARLQVVTGDGDAYLLVFEHGRWWVEAIYD
ncbi:MAG: DNA polymerase Y family protein [Acidimicrobiales bacterium]